MDFAARAHARNYDMDPIVDTRADTDFYKVSMGQVIDARHPMTTVAFELTNRTRDVRVADIVTVEEMREQLDHVRALRWSRSELINVAGQTYAGASNMFSPGYIHAMELSRLPDYALSVDAEAGQFVFRSEGRWLDVKDWEVHVLAVVNELRNRAVMRTMSRSGLQIMYARAMTKLFAKLERLARHDDIIISDFGTRRRHSLAWQDWCVRTAVEVLGKRFLGTSNVHLAHKLDLEPIGTNAHELPMVYAALAAGNGDDALRASQYEVLHDWMSVYGDNLRIFLPDTFGTTQFLQDAPDWVSWWNGFRIDSKDAFDAGDEAIAFWNRVGTDATSKLAVFADGMDIEIPGHAVNGTDIVAVHERFRGRIRDTYGWGTMFTNDFIGCPVGDPQALKPISIVCKVASADGRAAVKLSDNFEKARSPNADELARYRRTFGDAGMANAPVRV